MAKRISINRPGRESLQGQQAGQVVSGDGPGSEGQVRPSQGQATGKTRPFPALLRISIGDPDRESKPFTREGAGNGSDSRGDYRFTSSNELTVISPPILFCY